MKFASRSTVGKFLHLTGEKLNCNLISGIMQETPTQETEHCTGGEECRLGQVTRSTVVPGLLYNALALQYGEGRQLVVVAGLTV